MRLIVWTVAGVCLGIAATAADPAVKVGDRVEALPFGNTWYPCTITSVRQPRQTAGGFGVRCQVDDGSMKDWEIPANAGRLRADSGVARARVAAKAIGPGGLYSARNPASCASTKDPLTGAPSVEQARHYVLCRLESEQSGKLYLIGNLKVEIGKGRAYNAEQDVMPDVNVQLPVYPLRGSLDQYVCTQAGGSGNAGRNCAMTHFTQAAGACWKTTFGDWSCSIEGSPTGMSLPVFVAPPK